MKADGYVIIETGIDNSGLEEGLDEARGELQEFQKEAEDVTAVGGDGLKETAKDASNLGKELDATTEGLLLLGGSLAAIGTTIAIQGALSVINNIKKVIMSIPSAIVNITKKVIGWGLGLFGVKSAYETIRGAVSSVMSSNEQIKNQLDVMKGALASAVEPIVSRLVNLVYTLFSYINQIVTTLTGKDLFAQAKKNLQGGAKASKEIGKQLASFDEMNILKDNSGAGAGGGGLDIPDVDSAFNEFLEKIKNLFLDGDLGGIAQLLSEKIVSSLNKIADTIASIDFASIGRKISEFLTNVDFSGILVGLVRVFGEALLAFQDMFLAIDWTKILGNIGTAIANAFIMIDEYINNIKWGQIGAKLSETLTSIPWSDIALNIRQAVWDTIKGIGELFKNIDWGEVAKTISDFINDMWMQTQLFFEEIDWAVLGADIVDAIWDFISNVDWLQLGLNIAIGILEGLNALTQLVLGIFSEIWVKIQDVFSGVKDWFKGKFGEAWEGVKNVFSKVGSFFGGIWNTIKSKFTEIGTKIGDVVGNAFKKVINGVLQTIENILNTPIRSINALLSVINAVPGINLKKLSTLKLPRLAKGGIVNLPGKGVPVGASAYAGETGREGVIPLTDSQQMALLGEAIGKYITVNATINNSMNGRLISRELQKINNESDFAFNR